MLIVKSDDKGNPVHQPALFNTEMCKYELFDKRLTQVLQEGILFNVYNYMVMGNIVKG